VVAFERQGCPACLGDATVNAIVDIDDLLAVILHWANTGTHNADVTGNGLVDIDDLLLVLLRWGNCP
jgi:hypothetical protein